MSKIIEKKPMWRGVVLVYVYVKFEQKLQRKLN